MGLMPAYSPEGGEYGLKALVITPGQPGPSARTRHQGGVLLYDVAHR